MSMTRLATYALGTFAATVLLAACSSGGAQPPSPSAAFGMNPAASRLPDLLGAQRAGLFSHIKWNGYNGPNHHKSWISPDIRRAPRLLFAGDAAGESVSILRLPDMSLKGIITGFQEPQGECVDRPGNIYIVDAFADAIYEYSRAGDLINTYPNTFGYGVGCAINPTNGDLTVANSITYRGGDGQVLIFSSPSSPPTVLTNPDQSQYWFAGYDPSGVLWVDGYATSTGAFILSSCSASSCSTIPISGGTIYTAGAVQWDRIRGTWVVFDLFCNGTEGSCSYPVSGSGVLGSPTTYLNYHGTAACQLWQGVIGAYHGLRYVVGGDDEYCGFSTYYFGRWAYPAGGVPTNHTTTVDFFYPAGAAVSTK